MIYERPIEDSFILFGVKGDIDSIVIKGTKIKLAFASHEYGLEIKEFPINTQAGFPIVLEVKLLSKPKFNFNSAKQKTPKIIDLNGEGNIELQVGNARVTGINGCTPPLIRLSPEGETATGWWSNIDQFISWDIFSTQNSEYNLEVSYEVSECMSGAEYSIDVAGNLLYGKMEAKTPRAPYYKLNVGKIKVPEGRWTLCLRPQKLSPKGRFGDIRSILLKKETGEIEG
jgi:hypothetical protein